MGWVSEVVDVSYAKKYGFQANFTGDAVGSLTVEASFDDVVYRAVTSPVALSDDLSSTPAQLGEIDPAWRSVKLRFTRSSGTLTVSKAFVLVIR